MGAMFHDLRGLSIDPVQLKLDKKAPKKSPAFTGSISVIGDVSGSSVTATGSISGASVTATGAISGASVTATGLTVTGNVVLPTTTTIGNVDATEIGFLDGVSSFIQNQLNGKEARLTFQNSPNLTSIGGGIARVEGTDTILYTPPPTPPTPVIVGAYLSTNTAAVGGTAGVPLTVVFDTVDFDTLSSYNSATGIFTAPRIGHYVFSAFARVTDYSAPNSNRIQSIIQRKAIGGSFSNYSASDTNDFDTNIKAGTGMSNIIIKLLQGEEIRYQVLMDGGGSWSLRGGGFTNTLIPCSRITYLSIHSLD